MKRFRTALAVCIACALACASERAGRTKLGDGSYELKCKKPLGDCLAELADVCREHGYDVVRATEGKERFGVEPVQTEVVTSKANIRCRSASALLSFDPKTATAPPPSATGAANHCFPGSTQACLGPGACKGAQTCRDDGARYGACDCGGAATPRETPSSAEATDAGPPATWSVPTTDGASPP